MIKSKFLFALFLFSFVLISCNPDDENKNGNTTNTNFSENFGSATTRDFIGQVIDENHNPIQNASVKIGTSAVQTDVNGVFIIKAAEVHEKFAYITATRPGFIDGSRTLVPTSGTNNVKIMLLSGNVVATVNSGTSNEVALPNGAKVNFDGNFKTENGNAYSGTVSVIMHHLDPADSDIADKMPGMLYAEDANGEAKVLETYGMMNVELRGSGGEKLQIANTAQIEMPITATQLATAPSTIPLWHFDEKLGYWIEEGSATKVGNKFVGNVSHFSWWNCDAQFPTIKLTVSVVDSNGNPLSNVKIELIRTGTSVGTYGTTDNNGLTSGLVPANETLTMKIYSFCGDIINSSSVGPLSSDTTLPNIVITNQSNTTLVQGSLHKCDNSNVTIGYVLLKYKSQILVSSVTNGAFNLNTLICDTDTSFKLEGFDFENLQTTDEINYSFASPITNVGNLTACNSITEFISYQKDNNQVVYILGDINTFFDGQSGFGVISQMGFYFSINSNIPGTYTTPQFSIYGSSIGNIDTETNNTVLLDLSNFGAVGEYIDMTFNGTYTNDTGSHTINGVVHVIRDN